MAQGSRSGLGGGCLMYIQPRPSSFYILATQNLICEQGARSIDITGSLLTWEISALPPTYKSEPALGEPPGDADALWRWRSICSGYTGGPFEVFESSVEWPEISPWPKAPQIKWNSQVNSFQSNFLDKSWPVVQGFNILRFVAANLHETPTVFKAAWPEGWGFDFMSGTSFPEHRTRLWYLRPFSEALYKLE